MYGLRVKRRRDDKISRKAPSRRARVHEPPFAPRKDASRSGLFVRTQHKIFFRLRATGAEGAEAWDFKDQRRK